MSHYLKRMIWLVVLGGLLPIGWLIWFGKVNVAAQIQATQTESPNLKITPQAESNQQPVMPAVFTGDLRDLPSSNVESFVPSPLRYIPGQEPKMAAPLFGNWIDPVVQSQFYAPVMPGVLFTFEGMSLSNGGSGWPPDENGDVGLEHYVQVVNTSVAIFQKSNGSLLWNRTFNEFFTGPNGTPCDNANRGDPIVVYDDQVNRWLVTDFAWNTDNGPFYECLAVSRGPNPLTDGWYFYALQADTGAFTGYLNDYPKVGVWADGWYVTANMFQQSLPNSGFGVRVWALDRSAMIAGNPLREVHFNICQGGTCDSLLPATVRGVLPPAGSMEYFLSVTPNHLDLWKMHVDWNNLQNSTLAGPFSIPVASFSIAASVPQRGSGVNLDSLSWRLMAPLQYQNLNGRESLWALHTVNNQGAAALRWYELVNPATSPSLAQQGTYSPDLLNRWMGSLAVDEDGNMALGYSVSSQNLYPEIRITGRLFGETPGILTQGETLFFPGNGGQTTYSRWGDYSGMVIDPVDDCTFWYTNEYFQSTGTNWHTRIGNFRYPSCGQAKGTLSGVVKNSETLQPVSGASITTSGTGVTQRVITSVNGVYSLDLPVGTYSITAGPFLPGYPISSTVNGVQILKGAVSIQNFVLQAMPYLVGTSQIVSGGWLPINSNPEPGEENLNLNRLVSNTGAATAKSISSSLISLNSGVLLQNKNSPYADIKPGEASSNTIPFIFSLGNGIGCGQDLDFKQVITEATGIFTNTFTLNASVPLARMAAFSDDVEAGISDWEAESPWDISTLQFHSPGHSWTDSPGGNYGNNLNISLTSPGIDLTGKRKVQISGWISYNLEAGYDYLLLEYSLNGGYSWQPQSLYAFTGNSNGWVFFTLSSGVLDNQSKVVIRFRQVTDASVVRDGVFLDDIAITYEPFVCRQLLLFMIFR